MSIISSQCFKMFCFDIEFTMKYDILKQIIADYYD